MPQALAVQCDIRHPDQVDALIAPVLAAHGRVDVLVNNAGGQFAQWAARYSTTGWRAVIDTNLNGTWHVTQAAGKAMLERGAGRIVNVIATLIASATGLFARA